MSIDENMLSGSSYFTNTINIFKKFSFDNSEKSLLIDFNGAFSTKTDEKLKNILCSIANCTSLLIVHLT
jgi:hypothetical protein